MAPQDSLRTSLVMRLVRYIAAGQAFRYLSALAVLRSPTEIRANSAIDRRFPARTSPTGPPWWAYRGLPPEDPYSQRPDIVVIRVQNIQQQLGMPPAASGRDILWVECKAPCHDIPTRWKDVIVEAADRLSVAYPVRRVYLILAIGLKWMPFLWDPVAPTLNPARSPLHILKDNQEETRVVDHRIHMISPVDLPGQRHVFPRNGAWIVDARLAYSLNFWTLDQNGNSAKCPTCSS